MSVLQEICTVIREYSAKSVKGKVMERRIATIKLASRLI